MKDGNIKEELKARLTEINWLSTDWTVVYHNSIQLFIILCKLRFFVFLYLVPVRKIDPVQKLVQLQKCEKSTLKTGSRKTVKPDVLASREVKTRMW